MSRAPDLDIRLVVEDLGTYADGSPRFQVGYEHPGLTNMGWECRSPEQGFLRILQRECRDAVNLAAAVTEHTQVVAALAVEIAKRFGVDLLANVDWPQRYVVAGGFGTTRIAQVETRLADWQNRLTDGHRCEHHRTCLDNCYLCPDGMSAGGPACGFDDGRFWFDKAGGFRREAESKT